MGTMTKEKIIARLEGRRKSFFRRSETLLPTLPLVEGR